MISLAFLDEANNKRLRFYRPTGTNPASNQWSRQATGYIRWLDEVGNYLDIDGNAVPHSDPDFMWKTQNRRFGSFDGKAGGPRYPGQSHMAHVGLEV